MQADLELKALRAEEKVRLSEVCTATGGLVFAGRAYDPAQTSLVLAAQ